MKKNTLRNAPLDGLSITLTWSIPENPPSQGPEDFFSNYQLRFKDSQPDSSIICIVKNDGWSTGDYPYSYQLQNRLGRHQLRPGRRPVPHRHDKAG